MSGPSSREPARTPVAAGIRAYLETETIKLFAILISTAMRCNFLPHFVNVVFFMNVLSAVSSSRILGVPSLGTSHATVLAKIGEELAMRGHIFTLLVPSWQAKVSKELHKPKQVIFRTYETPFKISDLESVMLHEVEGRVNMTQDLLLWKTACQCLLEIEGNKLKSLGKIDLIISDIGGLCPPLFADMMKVPRVDISPAGFAEPYLSFIHNIPNPVAYTPQMASRVPRNLSLLNRAHNLFLYAVGYTVYKLYMLPIYEELWQKYAAETSDFNNVEEVFMNCGLLLIPVDFGVDYPRMLASHVKVTGAILPGPPKALPTNLEAFMFQQDGSKTKLLDVVIVAFGTVISKFKPEFVDTIAKALAKVEAKVVWKHAGNRPSQLGSNTMVAPWIPQNDLLGHPMVKAFVSHGGLNSIYESSYHGVPMVIIPLFADQSGNAMKIQETGAGIILDLKGLKPDYLTQAVNKVIYDGVFAENAAMLSKIMQSRKPTPTVEAANWVEYMLSTNGSLHLRSEADNLYFYELCMLDVLVLLFILVAVTFVLFTKLCVFVCEKYCKKRKEKYI